MVKGVCSIIIPVYDREQTVVETVHSCLGQDYPFVEVVLVDDGSKDRSPDICERLTAKERRDGKTIRFVRQPNAGACAARNRGLALATGEFVMFLDSDDVIPSEKLSHQIAAMEKIGADCSISDFLTIDGAGNPLNIYRNNLSPAEFIVRLKSPSNSAIVMRRSSMPNSLEWNTKLKRMQDLDFMLRYLSGVRTWAYVHEPLYHYRLHDGSRISDTYFEGMPYCELFRSMERYLFKNPPVAMSRVPLLSRYGFSLLRSYIKDEGSRILPFAVKKYIKLILRKKTTYNG